MKKTGTIQYEIMLIFRHYLTSGKKDLRLKVKTEFISHLPNKEGHCEG